MNYYPYPVPYYIPKTNNFFARIFGTNINYSSILSNTSKTLNIINQAIPLVKQGAPIIKNAKTIFKVMNEFKREESIKVNDNEKEINILSNNNGPTFFT